ncbi:MAG: pilus assembly protein PilM [Candidatus Omnitrophica bacterium]|nr:pilus assembly protein PilM [Candidatus Omnitrophota bacterium]
MSSTNQLGLFWDDTALYFAEISIKNEEKKLFKIFFNNQDSVGTPVINNSKAEEEKRLVLNIQKTFKDERISTSTVNLSLPTKDIIYRIFTIPWMPPSEARKVVEFEAAKYLPFSLSDLSYTFRQNIFTQNNVKRLRIVFVAVKKDTLENYKRILNNALLNIDTIEPSPSCLLRAINLKNRVSSQEHYALVEKEADRGRIIIIADRIPQFVRDFNLRIASSDQNEISQDTLMARLINEIQISLDYFNRTGSSQEIDQVILLAPSDTEDMAVELQKNLAINVINFNTSPLTGDNFKETGFLNALGASLPEEILPYKDFDLSGKKPQASELNIKSLLRNINIKPLIPVLVACLLVITGSSMFSDFLIKKATLKDAQLRKKLGLYEGAAVDNLQSKNTELTGKLEVLKKAYIQSHIALFLKTIPKSLVKGMWLNGFTISHTTKEQNLVPVINLSGSVYAKETSDELRLLNKFLNDLKQNKEFAGYFNHIELQSAQVEKTGKYDVTRFSINCE